MINTAARWSRLPAARFVSRAPLTLSAPRARWLSTAPALEPAPPSDFLAKMGERCSREALYPPALEQHRREASGSKAADNTGAITIELRGRVAVWTLNQPEKLNPLNVTTLSRLTQLFAEAASSPAVDAVVLTGSGRYLSSGAAFFDVGVDKVNWPSVLHSQVARLNVGIFHPFIHFPKPLFIAANGPAVGGGTTMQLLCDAVLAAPGATFHTPFKKLGITKEGCSTLTFAQKMGSEGARRMLDEGEKLSAAEAARLGFVDVLVEEGSDLVAAACEFAEGWVSEGRGRRILEHNTLDELDEVNEQEGQQLASAIFSKAFWAATLRKAAGLK